VQLEEREMVVSEVNEGLAADFDLVMPGRTTN